MKTQLESAIEQVQELRKNQTIVNSIKNNRLSAQLLPYEFYESNSIRDLLLVCIYRISQFRHTEPMKERISKEDWNVQAFLYFPQKFWIGIKWATWPDTEKMTRERRYLKEIGNIDGNAKQGFYLTESGVARAKRVWKEMSENLKNNGNLRRQETSESPYSKTENFQFLSPMKQSILKRFKANKYFTSWDEIQIPVELTLFELADIIGVPTTAKPSKFSNKIMNFVQDQGVLSTEGKEVEKARKFLILQAHYNSDILGRSKFIKTLKRATKDVNLLDLVTQLEGAKARRNLINA